MISRSKFEVQGSRFRVQGSKLELGTRNTERGIRKAERKPCYAGADAMTPARLQDLREEGTV